MYMIPCKRYSVSIITKVVYRLKKFFLTILSLDTLSILFQALLAFFLTHTLNCLVLFFQIFPLNSVRQPISIFNPMRQ